MKLRAGSSLNAMVGPENLFEAVQLDHFAGFAAWVTAGETQVARGMPVLCGDDEIKLGHQAIGGWYDLIAFLDRKRAAGHEVVL